jgi:hypothetical protein
MAVDRRAYGASTIHEIGPADHATQGRTGPGDQRHQRRGTQRVVTCTNTAWPGEIRLERVYSGNFADCLIDQNPEPTPLTLRVQSSGPSLGLSKASGPAAAIAPRR